MRITYTDDWVKWLKNPFVGGGGRPYCLPVYLVNEDCWMVEKPGTYDYISVPNYLYQEMKPHK